MVISDEIHFGLILTGHEHSVYPSLSDDALNHTILCTAASKTFNLVGFKNFNIIIANKDLRDQYIETYEKMSLEIHMPNTLGLYATQVAYDACGAYVNDFLALIEMNYKLIQSFLDLHLPQIKGSPLKGTYFCGLILEH